MFASIFSALRRPVVIGTGMLGICLAFAVASAQPAAADARPLVLIVHGRGQLGRDSAVVRRGAWRALQRGFQAIDADVSLQESDVRLVWYADILDARADGARLARCDDHEPESAATSSDNPLMALVNFADFLLEAAVADTKDSAQMPLRSLAGDLRYLGDLDTRCAAEARVTDALRQARRERRPVILISHSLGALVTWGALTLPSTVRDTTIPEIARWITMGSPLGSTEVRTLLFGQDRALELPSRVGSWANVLGQDDPFAMRVSPDSVMTSTLFDVTGAAAHDDPHLIASYLADPATARLVLESWRSTRKP